MLPADILEGAATYISDHGHAKGCFRSPSGEACLVGAMRITMGLSFTMTYDETPADFQIARDAIARQALGSSAGRSADVVEWNDAPCRTADEVVEALRRAAKSLR